MRAALAEKLAKDEEEARRKEEQVQLKDQYKQAVDVWKNKNKVRDLGRGGGRERVCAGQDQGTVGAWKTCTRWEMREGGRKG